MAKKAKGSSTASSRPVTRSQQKNNNVDVTTYQTLNGADNDVRNKIQVVSRRGLKPDPNNHAELEKRFARIEAKRLAKEENDRLGVHEEALPVAPELWERRNVIFMVTHFNVFLYATCFFIQVGTLPYLSKKLGADPTTFGQLQTVFAVTQLLGGPLFGRVGDTCGEKLALILAFSGATLSYFLMGISESIPVLFLSRIPSVVMHTMQGSQMIVTYLSEESERANVLARLGFSYGIGMVVGPTLGGYITSNFSEQTAALFAASGSLLSVFLVIAFIPFIPKANKERKIIDRTLSNDSTTEQASKDKTTGVFKNIKAVFKVMSLPGVGFLLFIKLVCGIPIGILQSMFSMIAINQFGMNPEQNGMMLSYIGAISLFMQGIGISTLTKRADDKILMGFSTMTLTVSYFVMTLIKEMSDFLALLFPLTCSLCLINSIVTAAITKAVSRSDTGSVLGLNMAVHSAIRSFAPTLGGFLVQAYGFASLGFIGVICNSFVLVLLKFAPFQSSRRATGSSVDDDDNKEE